MLDVIVITVLSGSLNLENLGMIEKKLKIFNIKNEISFLDEIKINFLNFWDAFFW